MLWLVVTGSREVKDTPDNRRRITTEMRLATQGHPDAFLLVGDCRGLDTITLDIWRTTHHRNRMRYRRFDADWDTHGLRAGPRRNRQMIEFAVEQIGVAKTLAFYQTGAANKGTANCANLARRQGIEVTEIWMP